MILFACVACVKVGVFLGSTITQDLSVFGVQIVDRKMSVVSVVI